MTETLTGALANMTSLVNWCLTTIQGNEILMFFFCAGIVPVGIRVFRKLKNSAR